MLFRITLFAAKVEECASRVGFHKKGLNNVDHKHQPLHIPSHKPGSVTDLAANSTGTVCDQVWPHTMGACTLSTHTTENTKKTWAFQDDHIDMIRGYLWTWIIWIMTKCEQNWSIGNGLFWDTTKLHIFQTKYSNL